MTPFTEVLIVFGTQRPKEDKEGLNKEESDFINGLEITYNAMSIINEYCKIYGVLLPQSTTTKKQNIDIFFYKLRLH